MLYCHTVISILTIIENGRKAQNFKLVHSVEKASTTNACGCRVLISKLILYAKRSVSGISFLDFAFATILSLVLSYEIQQSKYFCLYRKAMSFFTVSSINVLCEYFLFNVESTDVLSTSICMYMLFRILQYAFSAKYAANAFWEFSCIKGKVFCYWFIIFLCRVLKMKNWL